MKKTTADSFVVKNWVVGWLVSSLDVLKMFLLSCASNSEEVDGNLYLPDLDFVYRELNQILEYLKTQVKGVPVEKDDFNLQ